jgi:predicted TIM-barrel fold metal-dependent hydrolase
MKVVSVGGVSFTGNIIDSHVHIGKWGNKSYPVSSIDSFTRQPLENGDTVDKMLVSSLECINDKLVDEYVGNKQLLSDISSNSKLYPIAVAKPDKTCGSSSLLEKLFKDFPNKFIGMKFHPESIGISANSTVYDNYITLADRYSIPCLFHSAATYDVIYPNGHIASHSDLSRPGQIYELARRHKNSPIIMAHMGGNFGPNAQEAIDVLVSSIEKGDANLYADISWVNADTSTKPDIILAIKKLQNTSKGDMTHRLLFGSDAPLGCFGEYGGDTYKAYSNVVQDIKTEIKKAFPEDAEKLIDKIFYQNAQDLYFGNKSVPKSLSKLAKLGIGVIVMGVVVGVVAIGKAIKKIADSK